MHPLLLKLTLVGSKCSNSITGIKTAFLVVLHKLNNLTDGKHLTEYLFVGQNFMFYLSKDNFKICMQFSFLCLSWSKGSVQSTVTLLKYEMINPKALDKKLCHCASSQNAFIFCLHHLTKGTIARKQRFFLCDTLRRDCEFPAA